jgi:serine/threonine protein kinase/tetratricopeptide (TPR) repeat protein
MEWQPRPEDAEVIPRDPREKDRSSPLPEHIGVYRIESRLGRGGMGEVLLGWDERLERRVAIKRIRQDSGLSPEQRERFRREARLAARLSHSVIVQIHDLVTEGTEDAIVMEYVEGRTLAERLAAGPLEPREALRLGIEIADGLATAHEAGLIHRDLKAANVIVTPAGHAKILDFGLARPTASSPDDQSLTRPGMVMGTLYAMSPEQARGEDLDERSDLFSFGALLYEMLTGHAPFRSRDTLDSLRRVVHEPHSDPRSLRPDLPEEIPALLNRLLAKDRRDRPASARAVIADLESMIPAKDGSASASASVSELPTITEPRWKGAVAAVHPQTVPPSTIVGLSVRSLRRTILAGGVGVALVAALGLTFWLKRPAPPLRVVVARPEVRSANDEQLDLVASGVLTAELSGLASLQGMAAIDPREVGSTSPIEMTRKAAADEVLTAEVEREGMMSWVSLRRVRGSDGAVLWTETFRVPANPESFRLLNNAVAIQLRQGAYPDHPLRPGTPELDVRDQDYAAFLDVWQRIEKGDTALDSQLAQLEEIARQSPRFLEGQLLAARVALSLFQTTKEPADLDRATERARQSRDLAPADPRPLQLEFKIALAAGRERDAEEILARIEGLLPGDPDVLPLRAKLAQLQGRPAEALEALRTAATQVPSWQNLFLLARLEVEQGQVAEARERIAGLLRQDPDNPWVLELLGQLELAYGDLARAEQIYLSVVPTAPRRAWNSIGLARFQRGQYREAAAAYRSALEADPDAVVTQVNLADAEAELGHREAAEAFYQQALDRLAASAPEKGLGPRDAMMKAHCLAGLGRTREAVNVAQEALQRSPDDPELLYVSALVHSLAGDRSSAFNNAQAALEKGMQPRWFRRSAFRFLREDPELRPLLDGSAATATH